MRRPTLFTAAVMATAALILGGSSSAFALWTASASVSSTATAATVSVGHALSASTLARTYTGTDLIGVGVVTVTNSSTRAGTYSLVVSSTSGSSTLRAAVAVEVGTAASCTTTATLASAVTGTMASGVTATGSLAAGASVALCVRTSMTAGGVSANSSATLTATIATSVTVGTWSATASPALSFAQSVSAPTQTVDQGAWYWIMSTLNSSQCAEDRFSSTTSGSPLVQNPCTAPTGSDANELFRFVLQPSGSYRIINKAAPALAMTTTNGNNRPVTLTSGTGSLVEWSVTFNADSTITLTSTGSTRCLNIPGSSTTAGLQWETANCATSAAQKFTLTMFNTATPVAISLSCSADGFNAYYSWPQLVGYETEVVYRTFIGGILVSPQSRGTGWDPTVQFSFSTVTTTAYGAGSKTVLVEQSLNGGPWTTVGSRPLIISASTPYLTCG